MELKQFKIEHIEFCNRFNETIDMYYRCAEYLVQPERTPKELNMYNKFLTKYGENIKEMLIEYKSLTKHEMPSRVVLGGFIIYTPTKVKPGEKFIQLEIKEG